MGAEWFFADLRVYIGCNSQPFIFFTQVNLEIKITFLKLNGTIIKREMPIDFHIVIA